jgi:hypothetical protein
VLIDCKWSTKATKLSSGLSLLSRLTLKGLRPLLTSVVSLYLLLGEDTLDTKQRPISGYLPACRCMRICIKLSLYFKSLKDINQRKPLIVLRLLGVQLYLLVA